MRTLRQRVFVTFAATVLAAGLGILATYFLSRSDALHLAEDRLRAEAEHILVVEEAGASESRAVLARLNASTLGFCSEAEIASFRKLIYQSEYLKDAGRMRDGRIECSATLSREDLSRQQYKPDLTRRDGSKVYRDPAPLQIGTLSTILVQLGDSYIVYNPFHERNLKSSFMHYLVTDRDIPSQQSAPLSGGQLAAPAYILTKDGDARFGGSLYATRCSKRFTSCMTTYMTVSEALQSSGSRALGPIALGGLIGATFGFLLSFFYGRSRSIEQQLRRAIRGGKVRMVYQPIVELVSGRTVGAEALARWTDEYGEAVGPDIFVGIAEEHGFVGELTRLVVREVLREFGETLRNHPEFWININVAATDLGDAGFLPMLEDALHRAEVLPSALGIEITESCTVRKQEAVQAIRYLRTRGHCVFIDDFGTGYSSLSYLKDLSVDAIKIDKVFTQAIGTEAVTAGILPQILSIAEALNLRTIVEGIETVEQAGYFAGSARPILGQGWLFGRPAPAESLQARLVEEEDRARVHAAAI